MKRSYFKKKIGKPLKRTRFQRELNKFKPLDGKIPMGLPYRMKRTKLRVAGVSTTAQDKKEIQRLVREIVIKRDQGCVLRRLRNCGGEIGQSVLQADHLITRANSSTYADTRLIVCLCKACHGGFKQWHEKEYESLVKKVISQERVELWDKCEEDRQAHRTWKPDWKLAILLLNKELEHYQ